MAREVTGLRNTRDLIPEGQLSFCGISNLDTGECRAEIRYHGPGKNGEYFFKAVKTFTIDFDTPEAVVQDKAAELFFWECSAQQDVYI